MWDISQSPRNFCVLDEHTFLKMALKIVTVISGLSFTLDCSETFITVAALYIRLFRDIHYCCCLIYQILIPLKFSSSSPFSEISRNKLWFLEFSTREVETRQDVWVFRFSGVNFQTSMSSAIPKLQCPKFPVLPLSLNWIHYFWFVTFWNDPTYYAKIGSGSMTR